MNRSNEQKAKPSYGVLTSNALNGFILVVFIVAFAIFNKCDLCACL